MRKKRQAKKKNVGKLFKLYYVPTLCILSHLILITTLWAQYYYPHFKMRKLWHRKLHNVFAFPVFGLLSSYSDSGQRRALNQADLVSVS